MQTGSGGTEYTLRDLDGARRDPQVAIIFGNSHVDCGFEDVPAAMTPAAEAFQASPDMDLGQVRPSQDSSHESRDPLLASYD